MRVMDCQLNSRRNGTRHSNNRNLVSFIWSMGDRLDANYFFAIPRISIASLPDNLELCSDVSPTRKCEVEGLTKFVQQSHEKLLADLNELEE